MFPKTAFPTTQHKAILLLMFESRNTRIVLALCTIFSTFCFYSLNRSGANASIRKNFVSKSATANLVAVTSSLPSNGALFTDAEFISNVQAVSQQRKHLEAVCLEHGKKSSTKSGDTVFEKSLAAFLQPPPSTVVPENQEIAPCELVFWDLGANIGDAVDQFVNAGLMNPICPDIAMDLSTGLLREGIPAGRGRTTSSRTSLFGSKQHTKLQAWVNKHISAPPENYCYFGLEGNPDLTKRLQVIAARTMQTTPRPVKSIAFLTETVITDQDGPIQMFLEENAGMGSSIIAEKVDRSHVPSKKDPVIVAGISLETLLEKTLIQSPSSHLIIKMDIEGAEYGVVNKSWESLCDLVKKNMRVSMLLELHGSRKIGKNKALSEFWKNKNSEKLRNCGVSLRMARFGFQAG